MNVMDITKKIYTNDVYTAAVLMNQEETDRIEKEFQELWNSGAGFTINAMFTGRAEDSEAEQKACAQQIQIKLEQIVKRAWVSQYTRDEVLAMLNLLIKGPQGLYTRLKVAGAVEMTLDDISGEWNDAHSDQERVTYSPGDYIC